jgi:DNA-binding NtrC family response regulator
MEKKITPRLRKPIDPEAMEVLTEYDWPGNVRELENVLERAAILADANGIRTKDLALPLHMIPTGSGREGSGKIGSAVSLDEIEKDHIEGVLVRTKWNKNLSAKILDISLKTLYTKIQKYNLTEAP